MGQTNPNGATGIGTSDRQEGTSFRMKCPLAFQKEADPQAAALREGGLNKLVEALNSEDTAKAQSALDKIVSEVDQNSPEFAALKAKLLADAKTALDAGATMPPEFQAELVRTGLENAGVTGVTPDKKGAAGQTLRKLMGSAGLALQEQRRQSAVSNIGAATSLEANRASILGNLAAGFQQLNQTRMAQGAAALSMGQGLMPKIGLGGEDVVNMNVANVNLRNQRKLGIADQKALKYQANAEMVNGLIGAGVSLVGSVAGGTGGGAGGGAGGMGGMMGGGGGGGGSGIMGWGQQMGWWGQATARPQQQAPYTGPMSPTYRYY